MLESHRPITNLGILIGVLLKLPAMAGVMMAAPPPVVWGLLGLSLLSFSIGCGAFAAGKGYSAAWGLLGLTSFLGLMVLVLLPDKHPGGTRTAPAQSSEPVGSDGDDGGR